MLATGLQSLKNELMLGCLIVLQRAINYGVELAFFLKVWAIWRYQKSLLMLSMRKSKSPWL